MKRMKIGFGPLLMAVLFGALLAYGQSQVGEKAPGFATSGLDGKRVILKDYWEQKGKKAVVVSFFATWCAPCRDDLKYLQKVQERHGGDGLQVLCVLTQDKAGPETVKKFLQGLGVTLPVLLDEYSIIGKRYGVTGLPCNFLIDRHGVLRAKYLGYSEAVKQEFEKTLKELF